MTDVALYGAGGKMGLRIIDRLGDVAGMTLLPVEPGDGSEMVIARGFECLVSREAAARADVAVLAVPDAVIGPLATEIAPHLRPGALVIILDPAAPHAGRLPNREDIGYFVCHPAHPPIFPEDFSREALEDHFGTGKARQSIVCALVQGNEAHYALGESIARQMWGPILRSHRVTLEQMALLEPVLSESLLGSCLSVIREAMDEAVARGVPREAARDFLFGHLRVELAILFDLVPFPMSDGALQAIAEAMPIVFQPDWKERLFNPAQVADSVRRITEPT
jgi:hypothetical protein